MTTSLTHVGSIGFEMRMATEMDGTALGEYYLSAVTFLTSFTDSMSEAKVHYAIRGTKPLLCARARIGTFSFLIGCHASGLPCS